MQAQILEVFVGFGVGFVTGIVGQTKSYRTKTAQQRNILRFLFEFAVALGCGFLLEFGGRFFVGTRAEHAPSLQCTARYNTDKLRFLVVFVVELFVKLMAVLQTERNQNLSSSLCRTSKHTFIFY